VPDLKSHGRGFAITGWGTALPEKVVTNDDLAATMDTSDAWIRERTGIERRHIGGTTASLSVESARKAIAMSGIDPLDIEAVVLATTTPDRTVPATSATVQNELGLRCGAFDVNAACSGFVYGLAVASGLISIGSKAVLLIGTDTLSRIVDWTDRNTAILFADGSGAAVLQAVDGESDLRAWDIDADGSAEPLLYCEVGGFLHMDGKEVFRRAVRIMVDSASKSLQQAGLEIGDIALLVPHQANIRIIQAACDRLGCDMSKTAVNLQETGNTSSASIPLALFEAADQGRLKRGDLVLLVGFGAGMTAASAILRWNGKGLSVT
jgi:3-oxoacyl-[acyl-carrier-protein] synthase-3